MDYDVYILLHHDANICFRVDRHWRTKQYVRKLRAGHRAAPAIGETSTQRLTNQRFRLGGTSHMGHMHRAGYLAVNRTRLNLFSRPDLLGMLRCSLEEILMAEYLAVFSHSQDSHLMSQIIDILSFCLNAPFLCNTDQLIRILYLIVSIRG